MSWLILVVAGLLETVWAFYMKKSEGFTILIPSIYTIIAMAASVTLLSFAMRSLPLGTAYTVWTGIGAVGAVVVGIVILGEPVAPMRMVASGLIVAGILMMRMASA